MIHTRRNVIVFSQFLNKESATRREYQRKLRIKKIIKRNGFYCICQQRRSLDIAEAMHNNGNSKHVINMEVVVKN